MTALLILTKTDTVLQEMRFNHYAELVKRAKKVYEDLWKDLVEKSGDGNEYPWNIGIVPVTAVGKYNVVNNDVVVHYPEPENMDAAMVYSVAAIMKQRCQRLAQEEAALIHDRYSSDPVLKEAAAAKSRQLAKLREKLEEYVIELTQNNEIVPRILERKDVLGWWT